MTETTVRVRLAPSPTGHLHVGTARTGLFNWLFARQKKGSFILRIEDTDRERSLDAHEQEIIEGLSWLGLQWDEGPQKDGKERGEYGPYRQSERGKIYRRYLERLLNEGRAYFCYCSREDIEAERQALKSQGLPPKYSGHCRNKETPPAGRKTAAIRFKMPEAHVEVKDMIRGKVVFDAGLFGDIVIAKDVNTPLYNLAVVIDDAEMKITHVIRGEDHLSNTPKQILIAKALGISEPTFAHLPLILASDRSKLSKRYAETSIISYREKGYLNEAVLNFLALLGWHPQGDEEIFSPHELIRLFDIKKVQKAGAIFNETKLDWINGAHLKRLDEHELLARVTEFLKASVLDDLFLSRGQDFLTRVLRILRERLTSLHDFPKMAHFFFQLAHYLPELLIWDATPRTTIYSVLTHTSEILQNLKEEDFKKETLQKALLPLIAKEGTGVVLWPLRVAVSGRAASPDPLDIIEVIGKEETLRRISLALHTLASNDAT